MSTTSDAIAAPCPVFLSLADDREAYAACATRLSMPTSWNGTCHAASAP